MSFWAFLNNHYEIVPVVLVFSFVLAIRLIDSRGGDGQ